MRNKIVQIIGGKILGGKMLVGKSSKQKITSEMGLRIIPKASWASVAVSASISVSRFQI